MAKKINFDLWGCSTSPDYHIENGVPPGYTGGEYDTQYHGIVKYYTLGKIGPLQDGSRIIDIIFEIEEWGDPEHLSHHKGYYVLEFPAHRPRKNPVQTDDRGNEYVETVVKTQGKTSGGVYLPVSWIGHRVRVIRLN